jgi:hypothetical protein
MIFHETRRLMGRALEMRIGAPVASSALRALGRDEIAPELRRQTMRLGGVSDERFIWPAHVKW